MVVKMMCVSLVLCRMAGGLWCVYVGYTDSGSLARQDNAVMLKNNHVACACLPNCFPVKRDGRLMWQYSVFDSAACAAVAQSVDLSRRDTVDPASGSQKQRSPSLLRSPAIQKQDGKKESRCQSNQAVLVSDADIQPSHSSLFCVASTQLRDSGAREQAL